MKLSKSVIWSFIALTVLAALYRLIPGRPYGFAPQYAMAIFAGAVIADKKLAFLIPVLSMFVSDLLFQGLHSAGLYPFAGFYDGQIVNYLLFALLVFVGMAIRKITFTQVLIASLVAPTIYFLLSNTITWFGPGGTRGLGRPKTFAGWQLAMADGIPFYRNSLYATLVFSAMLFGTYVLITRRRKSAVSDFEIL